MEQKTRINIEDDMMSAVAKMVDGNMGAMNVCMQLIKEGGNIDPDSLIGGFGNILSLDTLGIYGTDIYVLYNDLCERNLAKTIGLLRACQLGFLKGITLADACSRQDYSGRAIIISEAFYAKVKERLPAFDPENIGETK